MVSGIAGEDGLSGEHLQEPSQTTVERDFARGAALMRFPATEFGQQLHLRPFESDAQVEEKACGHPA
jgi:hypothetical protein